MCHELRTRYALCSHTATVLTRCGLPPCQAWPGVYERVEGVSCQAVWCRFNPPPPPPPRSASSRLESSVSATSTVRESTTFRDRSEGIAEWRESNRGTAPEQQTRRAVRFEFGGDGGGDGGGGDGRGRGGNALMEDPERGGRGGGGPRRPGMPGGDDGDSSSSSDEENHNYNGDVGNESHA
ncbi:hypothetical protein NEUTE1DRAFT_106548 [Neurospora tetrasperma FGSC 2508]|uniref:Uncharacterized protein n=1 Tax=Neurospora tetrasperma (strain FGSC 2508 / ATCC MYA-4615 / P0657) TaxID=510951 RepID=F8MZ63_NEUT8|nr:uncharacterized protein NEUTE1DRAFT_106548 [Neurospora tetrasperma FGSC 2508]EGO53655.1 hypothetical protein NEUTE1DRAFT_106548 [Neurospora tetrasperma FGSC 2508]